MSTPTTLEANWEARWISADVAEMADRIASSPICSACCRDFVARRFSVATMTERYLDVYRCAMTKSTARQTPLEA